MSRWIGDINGNVEQTIEFQALAADEMFQRLAIEKFHGDEGFLVLLADVVNGTNVGMVQSRGGLGFALESSEGLRIFRDVFMKKFQGDKTVQANVFGFVDDAHATAAQLLRDPIVGYGLTDERGRIRHSW
jgi:hypothetical protein